MSSLMRMQPLEVTKLLEQTIELTPFIVRQVCYSYHQTWINSDLEEICQQIFLSLIEDNYHRLRTYDAARATFKTWLNRVITHYISHYLQSRKNIDSIDELPPDRAIFEPRQENSLLFHEQRKIISEAITNLGITQQKVIALTLEECSSEQIAQQLKIKLTSVHRIKHKAIQNLWFEIEKTGGANHLSNLLANKIKFFIKIFR